MTALQNTQTVQMSVLSADLKLIGFDNRREMHLSCDLINIARGNCNIILRPETSSINGSLNILFDRPIMNSEINIPPVIFDQIHSALKHSVGRPLRLILLLDEPLKVDNQGVLTIKKSIITKIKNMSWILPVR